MNKIILFTIINFLFTYKNNLLSQPPNREEKIIIALNKAKNQNDIDSIIQNAASQYANLDFVFIFNQAIINELLKIKNKEYNPFEIKNKIVFLITSHQNKENFKNLSLTDNRLLKIWIEATWAPESIKREQNSKINDITEHCGYIESHYYPIILNAKDANKIKELLNSMFFSITDNNIYRINFPFIVLVEKKSLRISK